MFVCFWLCVRALACAWACCAWERGSGEMITEMLQQETEMWFMAIVIAGGDGDPLTQSGLSQGTLRKKALLLVQNNGWPATAGKKPDSIGCRP